MIWFHDALEGLAAGNLSLQNLDACVALVCYQSSRTTIVQTPLVSKLLDSGLIRVQTLRAPR